MQYIDIVRGGLLYNLLTKFSIMIKGSYYERHKEERLEYQKKYNEENKYKIKERVKIWRGENREKINEYNRAYYANNKEKYLNRYRDRLARIEELEKENKKLKEELSKLKEKYGDLDY